MKQRAHEIALLARTWLPAAGITGFSAAYPWIKFMNLLPFAERSVWKS
jgi:hypothetical protein